MEFSAQEIAHVLGGTVEGNPDIKVNNFSKIEDGKIGTLTFLANPRYTHYIYETKASIVLVNRDFVPEQPIQATLIRVDNPYTSLALLLNMVEAHKNKRSGISKETHIGNNATIAEDAYVGYNAYIGDNVKIGNGSQIFPLAYVGDNVTIGDNTIIYPNVTIYSNSIIGSRCIIHSGAVIGSDGFGFAPDGEVYKKIPQVGNVIIEDDVEIGSNSTIDRAVMESTIIRKGVKIDNLVQIAHNVEIGENTVIAGLVGIAGSTKVGKHCIFAGQVGISGHLNIGNNVTFGPQSGIIANTKDDQILIGTPPMGQKQYFRSMAVFQKLPSVYTTLHQMEKEVERMKQEIENLKNKQ
ncbi:MAG: UDP-3-O-(3-hydroxymyristoyl)glucosamine N-acyltransferase [Bacteroidales bacterium]|nr:UDP-3-O-(3-hydroxymyristoyl)glucosamine N-acyltransferase [Bacteroidales bacterium]